MLIADYEYSRSNRENLPLAIQMHLSKQLETFFWNFLAVFESTLTFENFEIKNKPHNLSISEITDSERRGFLNA